MSAGPAQPGLKVGGTVDARRYVYIVRPSDDEVFDLLRAGEYCNVLCPRQMGKSSLLTRAKARLTVAGAKTVMIDVAGYFGTVAPASLDDWYHDLLREIVDQLGLDLDVPAWWHAQTSATPNRRLIAFFRDVIAARVDAPVVIILDEIDSTLKLPYADDVFVAIRAMYNDRASEPAFERVTFCLVGVASPNELIKDRRTTPYNVGRTIELRDFDPERDDLGPISRVVMPDDPRAGESLVRAAVRWTGGHPYLTLKLCEELARQGLTAPADVDRLIESTYPSLEAAKSDVHFETVLRFVNERVDDRLTALTLYRRIYRGRREPDRTTPANIALKLSGLVKRDGRGMLVVRNEIYRRLFTARWATRAMPATVRAVRTARLMAAAAVLLFLVTIGIWYEAIYPHQLATRLNAAIGEDRYALDTYQLLRGIPFYSGKADRLWAGLFERRAARAAFEEKREEALLWWLKALTVQPSHEEYRKAANHLIGGDYARLVTTTRVRTSSQALRSPPAAKGDSLRVIAFSPDGRRLAGGDYGVVSVWGLERAGDEPIVLRAPEGPILTLAFSPDGRRLAGGIFRGADGSADVVCVWDLIRTGDEPIVLRAGRVNSALAFSPDGSRLAAGGNDGVRIWGQDRPADGPIVLPAPGAEFRALAFSPDGRQLAAGGVGKGGVRVWDLDRPGPDPIVLRESGNWILALAFSPDGRRLAGGSNDSGVVRVWGLDRPGDGPSVLWAPDGAIVALAFSPDGRRLAGGVYRAVENDGAVCVWVLDRPGDEPIVLRATEAPIGALAFSPDGRRLVGGGHSGVVRYWALERTDTEPTVLHVPEDWIGVVAFSPDGRWLAGGGYRGVVRVWNRELAGDEPLVLHAPGNLIRALAFRLDGRRLAVGTNDGVRVWGLERTGPEPIVLRTSGDWIDAVAFSPDGRRLACGGGDGVRVWVLDRPGDEPIVLRTPDASLSALAFSPDGRRLAAGGSSDRGVRVWGLDRPGGEPIVLPAPGGIVKALAFSPDGRRLAGFNLGTTVRLWSLEQPGDRPLDLRAPGDVIKAMAFSPDSGSILIAVSDWVHLFRFDKTGFTPAATRLLPGYFPSSGTPYRFLDRSGKKVQVAVLPTVASLLPVTVDFDAYDTAPLQGDPARLLNEWQKKLALKITDTGEIANENARDQGGFLADAPPESR